jgi:ABC-type branched-subunit amino acid transport system substrate-binding protein
MFRKLLSLYLFAIVLNAQAPSVLNNALQKLESGQYAQVREMLTELAQSDNAYAIDAGFLIAKSYYRQKNYNKCAQYLQPVLKAKNDPLYEHALFLKGKSLYQQKDSENAVRNWLTIMDIGRDEELRRNTSAVVGEALEYKLDISSLNKLRDSMRGEIPQAILTIRLAKKYYDINKNADAARVLKQFVIRYPQSKYVRIAKDMLNDNTVADLVGQKKIGMILPLSGYNAAIGSEIQMGFQLANNELIKAGSSAIKLVFCDQDSSPIFTNETYENWGNSEEMMAVVGPVDNRTTVQLAFLSKYVELPLLSPTAGISGAAAISSNSFQLSPDYQVIASRIANYAMQQQKLKTFAILAPMDEKGQGLAESFASTVTENGGKIIAKEWYYPESNSFKSQFMVIRRKALYQALKDSVLEKYPTFSDLQIDSLYKAEQELFYSENPDADIDSLDIEIDNIDGVFIPIYQSDLRKMLSQFAFYNFRTTLLGNDGWLDKDFLDKNKQLIRNAYFASSIKYDEESWDYKNFRNKYRVAFAKTPGFYAALGYDLGRLLIPLAQDADNRKAFTRSLENIPGFKGLAIDIQFTGKQRVNSQVKLINFKYGQFYTIE